MDGLLKCVLTKVNESCIVKARINKEGCRVSLRDAPAPRLIVDFDKNGSPLGSDQVRCDYLFIAEDSSGVGWVCPMELKRGRFHTSKVVRQLQAGAQVAEQIVPQNTLTKFRPVAAFGRGINIAERDALKRKSAMISFRGSLEPVRLIKCGDKLTEGLR